jgi:pyruvate/2-oxoacid:ferredoxin oxidoreductase beta subunit
MSETLEELMSERKMTGARRKRRPAIDALLSQKRFSHITKNADDEVIAAIQKKVDEEWGALQALCAMPDAPEE